MDIKYQVFVSSTFKDLVEERKEVIQALLELDCIPVGMELFPATDSDQWTLIKELIDNCDYYILIVGGRYGSLSKDGLSYTQMEYEYALQKEIPIISFLHNTPEELPVSKTDNNQEKNVKLESFRKLAQQKMCKFWSSPQELGSVVSRSLVKLIKTKPRTGWVRADQLSSEQANLQILKLTQELAEYKDKAKTEKNIILDDLSQGDDEVELQYSYTPPKETRPKIGLIMVTWNNLFSKTCTILIDESKEDDYKTHVTNYLRHLLRKDRLVDYIVKDYFLSILIQFKALGLIEKSIKTRSLKDNNTYWKLTERGDSLLTQLRAIKKTN